MIYQISREKIGHPLKIARQYFELLDFIDVSKGFKKKALTPCALGAGLNCLLADQERGNFAHGQNYRQELVLAS